MKIYASDERMKVTRYTNPKTGRTHELHTPVSGHEQTLQQQFRRHGIKPQAAAPRNTDADLEALFDQLVKP
jgi:hypothetical protein